MAVTWLNHYTVQRVMADSESDAALDHMDFVGVDGVGLSKLVGCPWRSSADTVVPPLLQELPDARIALIGSTSSALRAAEESLRNLLPSSSSVVAAVDGYSGLGEVMQDLEAWYSRVRPTVVLLGLGAGLQERVAAHIKDRCSGVLILTCGGFLDQVSQASYYPRWAYGLRVNWLVRLAREPRRLWRRYTIDILFALGRRGAIKRRLHDSIGYRSYLRLFGGAE
jgi:exopolysaccharide biosynthesis WecB/TagA/CpsF family protein